jgi:hypothetical protein
MIGGTVSRYPPNSLELEKTSTIVRPSPPTGNPPLRVVRQTERVPTCASETGRDIPGA